MTKPEKKKRSVRRREVVKIEKSPYEILGISETADQLQIRKAYLAQLRLCPPEKDPEGFKRIRKAYSELEDRAKRRTLDLSIFKKDSGLTLILLNEPDYNRLFLGEIFKLMLSSSDFYIREFDSACFQNINEKIRKLQ